MIILAAAGIVSIAVASLYYIGKQEQRFLDRLHGTILPDYVFRDMEGDTVRIYPDRTTILLFWATWSERSLESLQDLHEWHRHHPQYEIIAAFVKDTPDFVRDHEIRNRRYYRMLDGTKMYQDLRVPGVPSVIVFDERGEATTTGIGSQNVPVWHELTTSDNLQPGTR